MRSASLPAPSDLRVAASARRARFVAWLARVDLAAPGARYVLRSILAAWLALTVAYLLQLETPYSAASTVLLVINPVQGAVIGKGAWRVLGTLVGMLAAVVLMSAFAQMPWLFVLGFGAWLGLCVAGMTLLRHFRASGTVVAGYTVGLATFGAMQHPLSTFEHVVGRGSTVVVGVVCLGLVSALFSARAVGDALEIGTVQVFDDTTQSWTNRIPVREENYTNLTFYPDLRRLPAYDETLPGFDQWERESVYLREEIRLPEAWGLRFFDTQLSAAQLYAVFQVTDTQQNTFCTP
ncbi:MAG: FUSC family protein, partial [Rudaea sp.]|nr:FUSC family protein [Rudaea sp.]